MRGSRRPFSTNTALSPSIAVRARVAPGTAVDGSLTLGSSARDATRAGSESKRNQRSFRAVFRREVATRATYGEAGTGQLARKMPRADRTHQGTCVVLSVDREKVWTPHRRMAAACPGATSGQAHGFGDDAEGGAWDGTRPRQRDRRPCTVQGERVADPAADEAQLPPPTRTEGKADRPRFRVAPGADPRSVPGSERGERGAASAASHSYRA